MNSIVRYILYACGLFVLIGAAPGIRSAHPQAPAHVAGRALLVGINGYKNFPRNPTPGSEEDAIATKELIKWRYDFREDEIRCLLGSEATAGRIVAEFRSWLIDGTRPGERVFFLYSGHGTRLQDNNGDEGDGEDEAIAPYDVDRLGNNIIRDDVFNQLLSELSGRMAVMVFDSCHSGTISRSESGDAPRGGSAYAKYLPSPEEFAAFAGAGTSTRSAVGEIVDYVVTPLNDQGARSRDLNLVVDRAQIKNTGVVIFSAAQSGRRAFPIEVKPGQFRGALSYAFNEAHGAGVPKLRELKNHIVERIAVWQQAGRLNREQQPSFEVISGKSEVPVEEQPLFGAAQMAEVLTEGNPGSRLSVKLRVRPDRRSFRIGEEFFYEVETSEEGYLYLLVFSEKNQATCLFPNPHLSEGRNNLLLRGMHRVPPAASETYKAQLPIGRDVVIALLTKTKLNIGEKEDYTWGEIFERLRNQKFFEYVRARGIGTGRTKPLEQTDWQAVCLLLETIE
jgi:hypothetical protein